MSSPDLEIKVDLVAPLALASSVGDDHLDRITVDLVGNAAPPVEEVCHRRITGPKCDCSTRRH
jgi:hypothetical protein